LKLMIELGINPKEVRLIGGGSKSPLWRKIISDVFGLEVHLLKVDEGSSYGAAILAAVTAQEYSSVEKAVDQIVHLDRRHDDLARRFDLAWDQDNKSYCDLLRHRIAVTEGVRDMYYEYATRKANEIADLRSRRR